MAGGELIFSKKKLGRFPQPGEVLAELRRRLSPDSEPSTPSP